MFSFVAPLLIVLSLVGITVIVLRRTPEIRDQGLKKMSWSALRGGLQKLAQGIRFLAARFWQFVMEVKGLSGRQSFRKLPQAFSRIHFQMPKLSAFGRGGTTEFFLHQGEIDLEAKNYVEAERKFIKVIEKDPHNEQAYSGLGKLYLAQKKYEEAVQTFKFLVKHHPENDGYHSSLGRAYHGQKLYEKAVEAFERAIELSPEKAKRYVNLGLTLEAQKHVEEAILNYRKAADMEKDNTQFLMVLADALVKKDEKEQAEILLEQVLVLEPTNHLAREKLMALKF